MTYNEFQRELRKRGLGPQEAFMFTMIYERIIEQQKQLDGCVRLLTEITNSVTGFVELHEATEGKLQKLMRGNRPDGVDVYSESVVDDPSKKN